MRCANVVGYALLFRRRHVATGAGRRRGVIDANDPRVRIQVHAFIVGEVGVAVLRFFVDFLLGMVRAEVALGTRFRLASLRLGKSVAGVAGVAGPE